MRSNLTLLQGVTDDIHHYGKKLQYELGKLKTEKFSEEDKKLIAGYVRFLQAQGLNKGRLAKASYQLRTLRRHQGCNFRNADRKAIEQLVIWINNSDYSPWSKLDAKGWIKRFYRWLKFGTYLGDFPEDVGWIKARVKQNERREPDVLIDEEAEKMIFRATCPRDKALIAVMYEGGFRIGEILNACLGDITFDENGARVHVTGKTGPRTVRLITSASLLARWMEEHPRRGSYSAPAWVSFCPQRRRPARVSLRCQISENSGQSCRSP
jgi:integrase/recombinase XerD